MLEKLKNLDVDRPDLEELIYLSAQARALRAEFEAESVEVPEWLDNSARALKREVRTRLANSVDKRVREIKSRLDALKTPSEKKAELEAELATLTAGASA